MKSLVPGQVALPGLFQLHGLFGKEAPHCSLVIMRLAHAITQQLAHEVRQTDVFLRRADAHPGGRFFVEGDGDVLRSLQLRTMRGRNITRLLCNIRQCLRCSFRPWLDLRQGLREFRLGDRGSSFLLMSFETLIGLRNALGDFGDGVVVLERLRIDRAICHQAVV